MTTVAAYISKEENRVYMACDSQASNESYKEFRNDLKILRIPQENPRMLLGFAGSLSAIQTMMLSHISPPTKSDFISMVKYVTDEIRLFLEPLKEIDEDFFFEMLLAFDGKIFGMQINFCLSELVGNYNAIGSGRDYAIGALYALDKTPLLSARDKLIIALEASCNNDISSGGTINVEYV